MEKETRRIPIGAWKAEGEALFGDDPAKWPFLCPNCGHVQTIADFVGLRDLGLFEGDPEAAMFCCIGRHDPRIRDKDLGRIGNDKSPCDYALGGLFAFCKTILVRENGKEVMIFEFYRDGEGGGIKHEASESAQNSGADSI